VCFRVIAGRLTSFRTAVETPSLHVQLAHEAGAAWFAASDAALKRTSVLLQYSKAYLWELHRTPLMVPEVVAAPEDLETKWRVHARVSFSMPPSSWWLQRWC
jgi:hypothetical protein